MAAALAYDKKARQIHGPRALTLVEGPNPNPIPDPNPNQARQIHGPKAFVNFPEEPGQ